MAGKGDANTRVGDWNRYRKNAKKIKSSDTSSKNCKQVVKKGNKTTYIYQHKYMYETTIL